MYSRCRTTGKNPVLKSDLLGFELWIGDPAEIKAKRIKKQKTDRNDARLLLRLMRENNFPQIWVPSPENRDLRQLLWHRHQLVQMRFAGARPNSWQTVGSRESAAGGRRSKRTTVTDLSSSEADPILAFHFFTVGAKCPT